MFPISLFSQESINKYATIYEGRLSRTRAIRLGQRQQHNSILDRTREVCENQVVLCSQQHQVGRRMQEIRCELKRRGVSDEVIFACDTASAGEGAPAQSQHTSNDNGTSSTAATEDRAATPTPPAVPDRSTWFGSLSRQQAESVLSSKPSGTFLIRPSAMANRYALSVK